MSVRSATQLAQAILAGAGADIDQDGKIGRQTVDAFERAPVPVKDQVREAVSRHEGLVWDEIVDSWKQRNKVKLQPVKSSAKPATRTVGSGLAHASSAGSKPSPKRVTQTVDLGPARAGSVGSGWESRGTTKSSVPVKAVVFISRAEAHALADRFTREAGLPNGTLGFMLDIEAEKLPGGYDSSYRGGSGNRYLGLYQFFDLATHAWADGSRHAVQFGFKVAPMYPDGWKDPVHNTACAAGYAVMNRNHLRNSGIPVTKETLYACHQQGAGTFIQSVKAKQRVVVGKQSGDGVRALAKAYDIAFA